MCKCVMMQVLLQLELLEQVGKHPLPFGAQHARLQVVHNKSSRVNASINDGCRSLCDSHMSAEVSATHTSQLIQSSPLIFECMSLKGRCPCTHSSFGPAFVTPAEYKRKSIVLMEEEPPWRAYSPLHSLSVADPDCCSFTTALCRTMEVKVHHTKGGGAALLILWLPPFPQPGSNLVVPTTAETGQGEANHSSVVRGRQCALMMY